MRWATGPTSAATRSFISPAALLVNVIASSPNGDTLRSAIRYAMRCVSTRVLPEPAPATTRIGPSGARDRLALDRVQPREEVRRARGHAVRRSARAGTSGSAMTAAIVQTFDGTPATRVDASDLEHQRDRAVVHELDLHVRRRTAGRDRRAERHGARRRRRRTAARPASGARPRSTTGGGPCGCRRRA